jgi:spore maturation protein CgeB
MRILYVAFRDDYGRPERGLSFEHWNFYESLTAMGHEVDYFDIGGQLAEVGRDHMNERLVERARSTSPDLMFSCMMGDELDPDAVSQITQTTDVPTLNWFCDDHWRFEQFTARWAPCFSWVTTTAPSALPKYRALGYTNVIKTQWAAADSLYDRSGLPLIHAVTFVGQRYGDRPQVLARLGRAGIPVRAWGTGWDVRRRHRAAARLPVVRALGGEAWLRRVQAATRCEQSDMIRVFEQSRINLNLVASSQGDEPQIKGRTFEVPACGGFLLEGRSAEIGEYFLAGKEIVVYEDLEDLVDKARYFLGHDSEARAIAEAGYRRTHAEHTYQARFRAIFRAMGLSVANR